MPKLPLRSKTSELISGKAWSDMRRAMLGLLAMSSLAGCVQPYKGPTLQPQAIATQDQTAGIEEQDRVNRFKRLANIAGVIPPDVEEIVLPSGSVSFMSGPVPVVRVVFSERAFFAFDSAQPLPSSESILDVIAENMRRDVPDAALTILGHTDAIGTDSYNLDLSSRRAASVMQALIDRGVNPAQLSEVAIGKRQPIAPNDTPEGRALNRRVEFLISPALSANLAVVQQRVIPATYFLIENPNNVQARKPIASLDNLASVANVYAAATKVTYTSTKKPTESELVPMGGLPLSPASPQLVAPAPTMPIAPPQLIPPSEVTPRQLGSGISY